MIKWAEDRNLSFTRSRPSKSNNNAHVKQKNADVVRRHAFHYRYDTTSELGSFDIYYVMKDLTTGQSEAYYQALTGFTLAAGATGTLSFDGEAGPGHFPENTFSIYRSSKNQVDFTIEVSAAGVQVANATATKGSGAGDAAD